MPSEQFDFIFKGDASDAVSAAKKVTDETNKIQQSGDETNASFTRVGASVKNLAGRLLKATVAAFALKKVADGMTAFRDHVDEAEKLSRAIETSYENAQELAIAEKEAGLAAGSIRSAIEGIATAQAQGIVSPDLLNLGLTFAEIRDKKPDELFDVLSKRLSEGNLTARQFEAAVNVLGDSGSEVALKLAGNFETFRDIARDSGKIIEEETFGALIEQGDIFQGQITVLGEEILKLVTPFESFAEAATKSLRFVNEQVENLLFGFKYVSEFYKNLFSGLSVSESAEAAAMSGLQSIEKAKARTEAVNRGRSATENLTEERAAGAVDFLDFLRGRVDSGESDISSLQRVGLAATGGEAEGIRLQRRQLTAADSILKQLIEQTSVIQTQL
jgi:hypothetical protein